MKRTLLLVSLLALPLSAETLQWRGDVRAGAFSEGTHPVVWTIEAEARYGNWAFAPAAEFIALSDNTRALHANLRRIVPFEHSTFWIGAGPTFVNTDAPGNATTWNFDTGLGWNKGQRWEPFVAARVYSFRIPIFRDVIEGKGAVVSLGISRRFH